jgi:SAM-dependent methyltransferase
MSYYTSSTYGDRIADVYDSLFSHGDPAAITLLAELAGEGPVLELGIGTGRLALQLAERGVPVHGIDASTAMVAKLRAKPGGAAIPVTIGDFSDMRLDARFSLVFVAFNTIFSLETQEDQIRCFRSVAEHLQPDGLFLVEAFVPDLSRFERDQRLATVRIDDEGEWLEVSQHDAVTQHVDSRLVRLTEAGVQRFPIRIRYAWPSELDLMARLAGLSLRHRWSGWQRQPFWSSSAFHVSVYERRPPLPS